MWFSVFYFSGTGNTRWAVERLREILTGRGHGCEVYSVDLPGRPDDEKIKAIVDSSDYTGFAYPVYGANLPPIMERFIESVKNMPELNAGHKKKLFFISTAGYVDSFGPLAAKRLLKGYNFDLRGYLSLRISNNISSPKLKTKLISDSGLELRKEASVLQLAALAGKLSKMESYITGIGPYLIPGILIRKFAARGIRDNFLSLGVRMDSCSKCMLCVSGCPTQSIAYDGREFRFNNGCTACMRCYNFCPAYSITLDGKYADPEVFFRYRGPLNKSRQTSTRTE